MQNCRVQNLSEFGEKLKKNLIITQNVSGISFSNQTLYMYITTYIEQYIAQL